MNIQWQIVNYWQQKEVLPTSLSDLEDPISGFVAPVDAQTEEAYEYAATGKLSFELCANFNAETQTNSSSVSRPIAAPIPASVEGKDFASDTWQHGAGRTCFERTIDPQRYPPYPKQKSL